MNTHRPLIGQPWLIRPEALISLGRARARAGATPSTGPVPNAGAGMSAGMGTGYRMVEGGVAVVPVHGPIYRHSTPFDDFFAAICGGTCLDHLGTTLDAALSDPACRSIVLAIDSPGGEAAGLGEFAAAIRRAAGVKPIAAYAESTCCSAAYYLAAATGEIWAAPMASVGSIGVACLFVDESALLESLGVREIRVVSSQTPGKWVDPATDEGLGAYQAIVDAMADVFLADVAAYRGVPKTTVQDDYGQGGVLVGDSARKAGLVDRVGTFHDLAAKLSGPARNRLAVARPATPSASASASPPVPIRAAVRFL